MLMMNNRLKAWVGFNDGNCDEDTQLLINDIKGLEKKLAEAVELIKLSQTRLSTTPCENGLTLGENYTNFLDSLEEKEGKE